MVFRMRKSVKLAPGVRLTASHRGASVRVGPRGAGVSAGTSGRRTVSASGSRSTSTATCCPGAEDEAAGLLDAFLARARGAAVQRTASRDTRSIARSSRRRLVFGSTP
jgi:hypothetical protein